MRKIVYMNEENSIISEDLILPIGYAKLLGVGYEYVSELIREKKLDTHEFHTHKFIIFNEKAKKFLKKSK